MFPIRFGCLLLALVLLAPGCAPSPQGEPTARAESTERTTATMQETDPLRYGLSGSFKMHPGKRDAVVKLLLRDVEALKAVGCHLYVVGVSDEHPDTIWVTEVWETREAHRASLQLPSVQQAIKEAMPMIKGDFEQVHTLVVGGLGVPAAPSS